MNFIFKGLTFRQLNLVIFGLYTSLREKRANVIKHITSTSSKNSQNYHFCNLITSLSVFRGTSFKNTKQIKMTLLMLFKIGLSCC